MAIADAIQFETFNTEGASNGSGIELGDDFNTFRKKTNGIINSGGGRLKIFSHTLIKYVNNQLSFENNFNIANVTYGIVGSHQAFTLRFTNPSEEGNYYCFGTGGSTNQTISLPTARGPAENSSTDVGTIHFYNADENKVTVSFESEISGYRFFSSLFNTISVVIYTTDA